MLDLGITRVVIVVELALDLRRGAQRRERAQREPDQAQPGIATESSPRVQLHRPRL
jgi:hypothetical protein